MLKYLNCELCNNNSFSGNDIDPGILVVVTEIYIHPLYDPSSITYDLAVVETHEEIPFSSKVGQACLPFKHINNDFLGDTVKVLGELTLRLIAVCLFNYYLFYSTIWTLVEIAKEDTGDGRGCRILGLGKLRASRLKATRVLF